MIRRIFLATILGFSPALAIAQQFNQPVVSNGQGTIGSVAASMPAVAGATNWLCGFDVSGAGSATMSPIQVSGMQGGQSLLYYGVSAGAAPLIVRFSPCLPANAANTAINISTTPDATATAVSVQEFGYIAR